MNSGHIENEVKLLEYDNIYWHLNQLMFLRLINIANTSKCLTRSINAIGALGHCADNRDLRKWIDESLPLLNDSFYTIATKVYWIIHGLTDFPQCHYDKCESPKMIKFNVRTLDKGYNRYCCMSHCKKSDEAKKKIEDYCEKKYGIRYCNVFQIPKVKEKCELSHIKNLGVRHPSLSPIILNKKEETVFKHYGVRFYLQSEEGKESIKKASLERFGVDNPMKSEFIKNKAKRTNMINYGVEYTFLNEDVKRKIRKSTYDHLGVEYSMQSPKVKELTIQNNRKKYECDWPSLNADLKSKYHSKYFYDNRYFDSKPEIAIYIWLVDNNISFEYLPNVNFEYDFNGKTYMYFPDFKIGDALIELKGDHFFKEGKMICPFRKNNWSDSKYQEVCEKYEAKHLCMIANDIRIIMTSVICIKVILKYISLKYGNSYLDNFKTMNADKS